MRNEQEKLELQARHWLAGTLGWERSLQTLRVRADLAPADLAPTDLAPTGVNGPEAAPSRDHLVAVTASVRPDVAGWDQHLDRTA